MTTKFETGKCYATRSVCDWDCIFSFTVLARTDKTVTVKVHNKPRKKVLQVRDDVEQFKPFGSYSMAAVIRADKLAEHV